MRTLNKRPTIHSSSANQIEQRSPNFDDHARFCSIKDSARSTQTVAARLLLDKRLRATPSIPPPTEDEENRTRKQRPAFQKCLETYNWHPWNHFFPERRGVSCLLVHDSSWRFLGKDETQPRPKTPKIIHRRCYIYIFMYICWNIEHVRTWISSGIASNYAAPMRWIMVNVDKRR